MTIGIWYCVGTRGIEFAEVIWLALPMAPTVRVLLVFEPSMSSRCSSCSLESDNLSCRVSCAATKKSSVSVAVSTPSGFLMVSTGAGASTNLVVIVVRSFGLSTAG